MRLRGAHPSTTAAAATGASALTTSSASSILRAAHPACAHHHHHHSVLVATHHPLHHPSPGAAACRALAASCSASVAGACSHPPGQQRRLAGRLEDTHQQHTQGEARQLPAPLAAAATPAPPRAVSTAALRPQPPRGSRLVAHASTKARQASSVIQSVTPWAEEAQQQDLARGAAPQPPSGTQQHQKQQQHRRASSMSTAAVPADALPLQLQQRALVNEAAGPVLNNLHANVRLNPLVSTEGAAVLGLTSPVGATSFLDLTLGKLAHGRMLACARSKLWWMTPEWRTSTRTLPPEIQFLLVELKAGGPYALLLPLIDGPFRATLRRASPEHGVEGELTLRVESGDDHVTSDVWQSLLHVSTGWDPYALVDRGVAAAACLSGGAAPLSSKKLPPSLDVFGWCTWDAFYSSVSAKGIQEGLRKLHDHGLRPRLLIIDDGWQMTGLDPAGSSDSAVASTPAQLAERLTWLDETERELIRSTETDFYMESMEVLAEAAKTLPAGTSAATSMPMLSNLGQEGARAAAAHHQHESTVSATMDLDAGTVSAAVAPKPPSSAVTAISAAPAPAAKRSTRTTTTSTAATTSKAQQQQEKQQEKQQKQKQAASTSPNPDAVYLTRLGQKVAGWFVGLGTAAFVLGYQWLVEPAAPGSLPVRTFAALANGPLRGMMLGFYSGASDFTRRLTSVRANGKFSSPDAGPDEPWEGRPDALREVVQVLRTQYDLEYIYCWHGLPGYWAGIMPTAPEMAPYGSTVVYARPTPGVLEVEPSMAWNPAVLAGVGVLTDPKPVYRAMHAYLAGSGVDGVKVDCQAGVGLVGSALGGGPALSRQFQAALEDSIAEHFSDNHAINCMCHSTENLYRMRDTAIARASDDFYPRDKASSQPHIAACAYNSLFLSALVQPDWDMFQSKHPAARLHAIARAVSGGAVYVSDKPGEHDAALLRQLVLPDGSVLRCSRPGRPTRDSLFTDVLRDGKSALKVWNVNHAPASADKARNGNGNGGGKGSGAAPAPLSGVLGVFHLQGSSWDRDRRKFYVHDPSPPHISVQVRPSDVEGLLPGASSHGGAGASAAATSFAAHVHGQPASALRVLGWSSPLDLRLAPATAEMVRLAPVHQCGGELSFAALGWLDMFNGPAGVQSLSVTAASGGASKQQVALVVRGAGTLLLYCSQRPRQVRVCGVALMTEWHAGSGALTVEVPPTEDLQASVHLDW